MTMFVFVDSQLFKSMAMFFLMTRAIALQNVMTEI